MTKGEYAICEYCGSLHKGWCERIESISYYPDGKVRKVKLLPPLLKLRGISREEVRESQR